MIVRSLAGLASGSTVHVTDGLAARAAREADLSPVLLEEGPLPVGAVLFLPLDPLRTAAETVERLLDPDGCPWDRAQTHQSLRADLQEELAETLDALDRSDLENLREELGDLLLHVLLHTAIERRAGGWSLGEVAAGLDGKLIARHPHVFGDATAADAEAVLARWHRLKAAEKSERTSVLDGVPLSLPSLARAQRISRKAARAGFEWPDVEGVFAKLDEELVELRAEIGGDPARIEAELGDVLFTVVNLARWLKVDAETALRTMLARFEARFRHMESHAGGPIGELSPEAWDVAWEKAKIEAR